MPEDVRGLIALDEAVLIRDALQHLPKPTERPFKFVLKLTQELESVQGPEHPKALALSSKIRSMTRYQRAAISKFAFGIVFGLPGEEALRRAGIIE